jgi:hypothetical protein
LFFKFRQQFLRSQLFGVKAHYRLAVEKPFQLNCFVFVVRLLLKSGFSIDLLGSLKHFFAVTSPLPKQTHVIVALQQSKPQNRRYVK